MKSTSLVSISLIALACTPGQARAALQYVTGDPSAQARVLATDSSGNLFTVLNVTEPSGRPQIRVIKSNAQGVVLATLDFGGSSTDTPSGAVTDPQGNLIIVGTTNSTDFPTVSPVVSATDPQVAFVMKINALLTQILFSSRLGGSGAMFSSLKTSGNAIAVDGAGNVYVTGSTGAVDYPTTPGAYQVVMSPFNYRSDGFPTYSFVTELTPTGSAIVFSTFYGGSDANCSGGSSCIGIFGETGANAIAVDATGAVVIAGNTSASNLPVTAGTPGQTCRCNSNIPTSNSAGFVAKFPAGGKQLAWATYVNPSAINSLIVANSVSIRAVALDAGGNVIIGGAAPYAYSTTASSVQPTDPDGPPSMNSPYAGFVAKYSSSGQQILFSTFMGGGFAATATALPGVTALAVDTQGGIWLTGNSAPSELPFVAGTPLLGTSYVIGLSSDGTHLIGGFTAPAGAAGQDIVIGPQGNVATLGITGSILSVSTGQMPAIAGIASSAGFQVSGQVAPYELISLYGYGIGISAPLNGQIANGVLGNSLGGVQVLFDGIAAPLLYAGPNQINAIVPGEIAGHATTVLQVVAANLGFTTTTQSLPLFVVSSQPGIFATAPPPQTVPPVYLAVALNQDGTVNSATNPALPGSIMTVWATGSGVPNIPEMDGRIAGTTLLHPPAAAVSILSNASGGGSFDSLDVLYAGDAPDLVAGVIQINFQLPVNAGHGVTEIVEIQLQVGNAASSVCGIYVK